MSCATCRKKKTFDKVFELAQRMVEIEHKTYAIIDKGTEYDFIDIDEARRTRAKIVKILPFN